MLALILICLADPLIIPPGVPQPTAADLKQAEAMARAFQKQFFEPLPVPPTARSPVGNWTRSRADGTATVELRDGKLTMTTAETDAAGQSVGLTLRADCATSGPTLYGVVTHVSCTNLGSKAFQLEGAPFAATLRVTDGQLLLGRVRCEAGDSGVDLAGVFSGTYRAAGGGNH